MNLILVALLLVAYYLFYHLYWKRKSLPPGPFPLPLIGNLYQFVGRSIEDVQLEWRARYGDIFTLWEGENPLVVIGDYKLSVELFVKDADAYIGRPAEEHDFIAEVRGGIGGVILVEDDRWREHRRFALSVFRDFGLGKRMMEERMIEEIQTLCERIDRQTQLGGEVAINDLLDISVGSIINAVLFGYRYTDDKLEEFMDLRARARRFMEIGADPVLITMRTSGYVNVLKHFPFFKDRFQRINRNGSYLFEFFKERVREYKQRMTETDEDGYVEPTDYVMAYLQEKRKRDQNGNNQYFTEDQLFCMLFELWIAGQETTSHTMGWGIAHLVHNPQIQERLHEELDKVVESDRLVTLADKSHLPYMCAVVDEVQRIANILPINVIHKTTRDVTVGSYHLKKGTWIVPQISLVLYDPNIFDDPKVFNPDRFIDANGRHKDSDALIPFSLGKRQCLGAGLARMELFLFIANLVHQYKFLPGKMMPSLVRKNSVTIRADNYTCRAVRRFS